MRTIVLNLKNFLLKKKLEQIKKILADTDNDKQMKPMRELINIFYSNNLNFLNQILLMKAYNFHHVLQIQ